MVLKAGNYVMAYEISNDYYVKQYFRSKLVEYCVISTEPTLLGKTEITDNDHILYPVKRLGNKPIQYILQEKDQIGQILKGINDKLITVNITIPENYLNDIIQDMESLFLSTNTNNEYVQQWNVERRKILNNVIYKRLLPLLSKELLESLSKEYNETLLNNCKLSFRNMLSYNGYGGKSRNVVSLIWGSDGIKEPVIAVALDRLGKLVKYIRLDFMSYSNSIRSNNSSSEQSLRANQKNNNLQQLREFIVDAKPAVIVIGANCMHARTLYKDVSDILKDMSQEYRSVASVVWSSTKVPEICANTKNYEYEFPKLSPLHKCCIALGRMLQDPLPQYSILFNIKKDITSLYFHDFQSILPKDLLIKHLEYVLIEYINIVGLDINKALTIPHIYPCLQFICGLGPRKADGLRSKLLKAKISIIPSRDCLSKLESEIVNRNMIGFLKINPQYDIEYENDTHVLDNTRIHPDHYEYATQVMNSIINQLLNDNELDEDDDNINLLFGIRKPDHINIHEIIRSIDFIHDRELSRIPHWLLSDINDELIHKFKDPRDPFKEPSPDEVFTYLTGESDHSLKKGQLITAIVFRITPYEVWVKLDCDLIGKIAKDDLSDDRMDFNIHDRVTVRQAIQCRIKSIDKNNMEIWLTSRSSDLKHPSSHNHNNDPYLLPEPLEDSKSNRINNNSNNYNNNIGNHTPSRNIQKRPKVRQRMITHPLFKNISFMEAEELLENSDAGDMIFRPSSKGTDHITLTYKFHNECVHVDIIEEDKPSNNPLVLGKKLYIKDQLYHDLNHIEAHYLEPILVLTQEMKSFRRFSSDPEQVIIDDLKSTKHKDPKTIPYKIGCSTDYPGKYVLYYIPNKSLRKEYISCTPTGFKFRSKIFDSPNALIDWFKKNWKVSSSRPSTSHNHSRHQPHPSRSVNWDTGSNNIPYRQSTSINQHNFDHYGSNVQSHHNSWNTRDNNSMQQSLPPPRMQSNTH